MKNQEFPNFLKTVFIFTFVIFIIACGSETTISPPVQGLVNNSPTVKKVESTSINIVTEITEEIIFTPTPSLPDLEILSHSSYIYSGWYHIVGEIRNNSSKPMEFVKIVATLYNDAEEVMGSDYTYTAIDVIPPGGKSPFQTGTDDWEGTTNYKLQAQGREGSLPRQDIIIKSHKSKIDGKWLHIIGEVENTGTTDAEFVKIVVTLYDISNIVIGYDYTYTRLDIVPPGGTSPFETGTDHWEGFDHYEIQVQAR
jgi:hypothetical protein